jgi:hypothetical protein
VQIQGMDSFLKILFKNESILQKAKLILLLIKNVMKNYEINNNIYIIIRNIAFVTSSIVSALLNIFLFSSLDASWTWLLISMSLTLELTKVSTIVTRNCFASIYAKVKKASIKFKQHVFMAFYLMLALLSVTAGLGFSITITAKTEATKSINREILVSQRDAIQSKIDEINELALIERITLLEYPEYISINEKYQQAETTQAQANQAFRTATANRSLVSTEDERYAELQRGVNSANQLLIAANENLTRVRTERQRIESIFNERKADSTTAKIRLNEELVLLISQAGLETELGSVALIELDNKIKDEENKYIISKGMSFMFEEFAKYLHTTPELVKLWILLFVSILIETTIYQTSPDIKITRKVLYFFRNSLSKEVDVQELLNAFDNENKMYEDFKHEVEVKVEVDVKPPKRKYNKRSVIIKPEKIPQKENQQIEEIITPAITEQINEESESEPEVEPKVEEHPPIHANDVAFEEKNTIKNRYRFGKATSDIKDRLVEFISECIEFVGEFKNSPEIAAQNIKLNQKAKEVFLNRLMNIRLGDKVLVYKDQFGNYCSNFPAREIINYVTEVIND